MGKILPVILSGGAGTRLWPLSNTALPKQFRALTGDDSMFQMTVKRTAEPAMFDAPLVVAGAAHKDAIATQMAEVGRSKARMLLEPCARNTAPAIALAALAAGDDSTPMLVMPSDHVIADVPAFHRAIEAALPHVQAGWMVTFGIEPTGPETGYGYIQSGAEMDGGLHEVARFVEKPQLAAAQQMLADGGYAWNGGIFLMRADVYLSALEKYAPKMLAAARIAHERAQHDGNIILPDADSFAACPADSIDYAVMENAAADGDGKIAVVPVKMGWSDVGSWDALYEIAPVNQTTSDIESNGNYVRSDGARIHLAGVEEMIVVAAGNDIIITPRGRSQDVKKIVDHLKAKGQL